MVLNIIKLFKVFFFMLSKFKRLRTHLDNIPKEFK